MENTADPTQHSVLKGKAPAGAVLRLHKVFETPTSIVDENLVPKTFTDVLDSNMVVPASGTFTWHVNPSTSPLSVRDRGRPAHGTPSAAISFTGSPAGAGVPPAVGDPAAPCGVVDDEDPNCYNDHPFTVAGGTGVDNDQASIQAELGHPGVGLGRPRLPRHERRRQVGRRVGPGELGAGHHVERGNVDRPTRPDARELRDPDDQLRRRRAVQRDGHFLRASAVRRGRIRRATRSPASTGPASSGRPPSCFIDRGQVKTIKGLCK